MIKYCLEQAFWPCAHIVHHITVSGKSSGVGIRATLSRFNHDLLAEGCCRTQSVDWDYVYSTEFYGRSVGSGRYVHLLCIPQYFVICILTNFLRTSLFIVGIGQGTSRLGFSFSRTPMLLCSVPFFYEGIRSLSKKSKKASPSEWAWSLVYKYAR